MDFETKSRKGNRTSRSNKRQPHASLSLSIFQQETPLERRLLCSALISILSSPRETALIKEGAIRWLGLGSCSMQIWVVYPLLARLLFLSFNGRTFRSFFRFYSNMPQRKPGIFLLSFVISYFHSSCSCEKRRG